MNHFNDTFSQSVSAIEQRFLKFHGENPHVYAEFESRALLLIGRGRKHFGAKAIFEAMRFDWAAATTDEEFKLNNSYTAYYARMFEDNHSDYAGFFELRTQKE